MAAETPTVSVVVPTRDRPELLRRAVTAILEQTYPGPVECLVVFDQSDPDLPLTAFPAKRPAQTPVGSSRIPSDGHALHRLGIT